MDEKQALTEWAVNWIKHKDVLAQQIISIQEHNKHDLIVKRKTQDQHIVIEPHLQMQEVLPRLEGNTSLFTLNTQANLDAVLKHWDSLIKNPQLSIVFVNPRSRTDKKWMIYPYTHEQITEREALRKGLQALFESVEPWTEA